MTNRPGYLVLLLLATSCSASPEVSKQTKDFDFRKFSELTKLACSCKMAGHRINEISVLIKEQASRNKMEVITVPSDPISSTGYCESKGKNCTITSYAFNWSKGDDDRILCDEEVAEALSRNFTKLVQRDKSDAAFKNAVEETSKSVRSLVAQERAKVLAADCY